MRKLLYYSTAVLLVSALFFSCKKKDDPGPDPGPGSGAKVYGMLIAEQDSLDDLGFAFDAAHGTAAFFSYPIDTKFLDSVGTYSYFVTDSNSVYPSSVKLLSGGKVTLNSTEMETFDEDSLYDVELLNLTKSEVNWNVGGSGTVPTMSLNDGAFPDFVGMLPADIDRSKDLILTFNSSTVMNADFVTVEILSGQSKFDKFYSATAGAITIPSSELKQIPETESGSLNITVYTRHIKNFGGKDFIFLKVRSVMHALEIL